MKRLRRFLTLTATALYCALIVQIVVHLASVAQTTGWLWEAPAVSAYNAGPADNGYALSPKNVPNGGAAMTVQLPTIASVSTSWTMAFGSDTGHGVIINAPVGAYILAGQLTKTSLTLPSQTNFEFVVLNVDTVSGNFRLQSVTGATALLNGLLGASGGSNWTYLGNTGYSATVADNGRVLSDSITGAATTITLPSTPNLPTGWAITAYADIGAPITLQVNGVSGGSILTLAGQNVSSFPVTPASGQRAVVDLQFDGGNFRIIHQHAAREVDVSWFGAIGDGVTDNTAALVAAFAAAQNGPNAHQVHFPSGTWRWINTLKADGLAIDCAGDNNTFLTFDDPTLIKDALTIGNATFEMTRCNFGRKQAATAGALLHFTDSHWVNIYQNEIDGGRFGLGARPWNIIAVDSSAAFPNQFFVHDNLVSGWANDFVFLNSQNPAFPVYDFHSHNNFLSNFETGNANAAYEMVGYGQVDVQGDTIAGNLVYNIQLHPSAAPNQTNVFSFIRNNDIDSGTLYIANWNLISITSNQIQGPITAVATSGLHFVGNDMSVANASPIVLQGVTHSDFIANRISGQSSPITIQPSGTLASSNLTFASNSWVYSSGPFLTFSGTPVADDVTISDGVLTENEVAASFISTPTHFSNLGPTSGSLNALTFSQCSGSGAAGACSVAPGSTNEAGTIIITTAGGGEAATGIVHMTYAGAPAVIGPSGSVCTINPADGSGAWTLPVSWKMDTALTNGAMGFVWQNGGSTALTDGKTFNFDYHCRGF